jgi:hypothetical protein
LALCVTGSIIGPAPDSFLRCSILPSRRLLPDERCVFAVTCNVDRPKVPRRRLDRIRRRDVAAEPGAAEPGRSLRKDPHPPHHAGRSRGLQASGPVESETPKRLAALWTASFHTVDPTGRDARRISDPGSTTSWVGCFSHSQNHSPADSNPLRTDRMPSGSAAIRASAMPKRSKEQKSRLAAEFLRKELANGPLLVSELEPVARAAKLGTMITTRRAQAPTRTVQNCGRIKWRGD